MDKHTPGPWHWDGPRLVGADGELVIDAADYEGQWFENHANTDGNQSLVAAAPRLLLMLRRVLDEIRMTECGMKHIAPLTLEQADAAIRLAGAAP